MPPRHPFRKMVLWSLVFGWGVWIVAAWVGMSYFGFHRPQHPMPSQGRLFPFNDHGTIVYLTRTEHLLIIDLWPFYVIAEFLLVRAAQKFAPWTDFSN
jgi:hypothetical protein